MSDFTEHRLQFQKGVAAELVQIIDELFLVCGHLKIVVPSGTQQVRVVITQLITTPMILYGSVEVEADGGGTRYRERLSTRTQAKLAKYDVRVDTILPRLGFALGSSPSILDDVILGDGDDDPSQFDYPRSLAIVVRYVEKVFQM